MSEEQAVRYIDGECFVPPAYWSAVREYRKLRNIIDEVPMVPDPKRPGKKKVGLYSSSMDKRLNYLFDWLLSC
jgi:hypothetical protein